MSWRSTDHVGDALSELKVPRAPTPPELARECARGGRFAPHDIQPGEQFGDLTAVSVSHRAEDGSRVWFCKCSCGGEALKKSGDLTRAVRLGHRPSCRQCVLELQSGQRSARAEVHTWRRGLPGERTSLDRS